MQQQGKVKKRQSKTDRQEKGKSEMAKDGEKEHMTVNMSQDERNTDKRLMSGEGSGGREQLLTVLAAPWFVITVTLILPLFCLLLRQVPRDPVHRESLQHSAAEEDSSAPERDLRRQAGCGGGSEQRPKAAPQSELTEGQDTYKGLA